MFICLLYLLLEYVLFRLSIRAFTDAITMSPPTASHVAVLPFLSSTVTSTEQRESVPPDIASSL